MNDVVVVVIDKLFYNNGNKPSVIVYMSTRVSMACVRKSHFFPLWQQFSNESLAAPRPAVISVVNGPCAFHSLITYSPSAVQISHTTPW